MQTGGQKKQTALFKAACRNKLNPEISFAQRYTAA